MSLIKAYIHLVWTTKNRQPLLNSRELREKVWTHIMENARQKEIYIDCINGYHDHCHCLVSLGVDQTISKIMQLIKGESAHWINKNGLCSTKFAWQDQYGAFSIASSRIETVRSYIGLQEEHHKIKSFQEDFDEIIRKLELV